VNIPVGKQAEVFGEHAPDALEHEVAQRLGRGLLPRLELTEHRRDELDGAFRQLGPVDVELWLGARQETEGLRPVRELVDRELGVRLRVTGPPHLEARDGAHDDVQRRLVLRGAGDTPVGKSLAVVELGELGRVLRALHLDDAHARPEHVDEAALGQLVLEANAGGVPVRPVAVQQLGEERLVDGLLGSREVAPLCRECLEP